MSERASRENHFVPQFYLRYFSKDGKRVALFNFSCGRTIHGASIKHQCSRRNFYGFAPQLEHAFAEMEGKTARAIRCIKAAADIPDERSADWTALLAYIVFQKLRTTNSGKSSDAILGYVGRLLVENEPALEGIDAVDIKQRNVNSVALRLGKAGDVLLVASDLRGHLFINRTGREFITSDDPVVLHNQYCEGIAYRGVTGWNCRGLQVFWPISPRELLLLYDRATYRVGRSHRGSTVSNLCGEHDIAHLNSLQILNAHNNVYFAGSYGLDLAESECKELSHKRPKSRTRFVEAQAVETGSEESKMLYHFYEPLLPAKLRVSKISVRRNLRRVPLHSRGAMYRKNIYWPEDSRDAQGGLPAERYGVKKITDV